jgi:hypothetical protein
MGWQLDLLYMPQAQALLRRDKRCAYSIWMNISPEREPTDPPAAPADWTLEYGSGTVGEGEFFYADVMRAGKVMFRIGLGGITDGDRAKKLLAAKARAWIDEFLIREQQFAGPPKNN